MRNQSEYLVTRKQNFLPILLAAVLFSSITALRTIGIANEVVGPAFGLVFGAIAVAVALCYEPGGREEAGELFKDIIKKIRTEAAKLSAGDVPGNLAVNNPPAGPGNEDLQDRKSPSRDIEDPNRPSRGPEDPKTPPKGPENPDKPGEGPENPNKRPPGPADPNDPGGLKT